MPLWPVHIGMRHAGYQWYQINLPAVPPWLARFMHVLCAVLCTRVSGPNPEICKVPFPLALC